jgi:hypothetical protein
MHGRERAPDGLRTSPTGRVPQWVLDEAVGRPVDPRSWRSCAPGEPVVRKRRKWTGVGSAIAVVAVVALGVTAVHLGVLPAPAGTAVAEEGMPHPTPGGESSDEPLGTPPAAPPGTGSHGFMSLQSDGVTPIAYDPCRPIHYVLRPDYAPFGGELLIQDAVTRISQVTGLQFVYDGPTDEDPSDQREPFQPDRYGDRWAPVLISWETVAEQPDFAADVAGLGGSLATSVDDGPAVYVTGTVALDAAQFVQILTRPDGQADARSIVLHELAHVVGLAHVSDPTQLMYPEKSTVHDFAAGDLTGLAQLGDGACVPEL